MSRGEDRTGTPLVTVTGLSVAYGAVRALDDVSFTIDPGAVGLLGPNGAGKTTLLRVLLGLLSPTSGTVRMLDHDPRRMADRLAMRRLVGYMPEGDCVIPGTTGVDLVATLGRISGLTFADAMARAHQVLDYAGIDEARYRDAIDYSTGTKQRLKLAQALVHDPSVLLLDEPTNGLDPRGRAQMLDLVHDLAHVHGKSVLLCSHLLPDVERICRDVIVLNRGRIAASGNIFEMTRTKERWLSVSVAPEAGELVVALAKAGLHVEGDGENRLRVRLEDDAADADIVFTCAAEAGVRILSVDPVRSTLEDVFMQAMRATPEVAAG